MIPRLNSPRVRPRATRSSSAAQARWHGLPGRAGVRRRIGVLQPQAPASSDSRSSRCMWAISSAVAALSQAAWSIADRRSGLWPTSGIRFSPRPWSIASGTRRTSPSSRG